jgi:hypothetical protein
MSYAFPTLICFPCPGYWRNDMTWVEGSFYPEDFMVDDLITPPAEKK